MSDLRGTYESFVRHACDALARGTDELWCTFERPWTRIERQGDELSGSLSFPTEGRHRVVLSHKGEAIVAELESAGAAVNALQTIPSATLLLPEVTDDEGKTIPHPTPREQLSHDFVLDFLNRYLTAAGQPDFRRATFDELFLMLAGSTQLTERGDRTGNLP